MTRRPYVTPTRNQAGKQNFFPALNDSLGVAGSRSIFRAATRNWGLACTNAVAQAQSGTGTAVMTLPVFVPPALPTGGVAVAPGTLTRIFALVQLIKDSGKCSDANAADLGIVGTPQPGPDLTTVQPDIDAYLQGDQVFIKWGWGGNRAWLDSCELEVDRGDGKGYVFLTIDTTPGSLDTQPFPAAAVKWTYRARYRVANQMVGIWSQSVSVTVPA